MYEGIVALLNNPCVQGLAGSFFPSFKRLWFASLLTLWVYVYEHADVFWPLYVCTFVCKP